jgi:MFS family permease
VVSKVEEIRPRFSSIFSIVLSMTFASLGSGIVFSYVPFTLAQAGYEPWVAGTAVTAVAGGGLLGCFIAGPLIRRVGHARAFSCFAALTILSAILVAIGVVPAAWIGSRALYGFASNGNFIVVQSWLNHAAANEWRGRAMSVFYMAYVIGLGTGSFLFGYLPDAANTAPLVAVAFYTVAILPIGLTSIPNPPPPQNVSIDLRAAWRISPVAFAGILASGGLSMLVQGFTPIYAAGEGLARTQIAMLMFLMQLGMLGVQYPLGALSDRIDRRLVLVISCAIIISSALAASFMSFEFLFLAIFVFAIWSGATETVYSISNAHANDRTGKGDYVPLASTMLVLWSISAFVLPGIVTAVTPVFGPKAYMGAVIIVAVIFAIFALWRMRITAPDAAHDPHAFKSASARAASAQRAETMDHEG